MSDYFCKTCGKAKPYLNPQRHKCPPRWRVWWFDDSEYADYDPDCAQVVHADDAREAGGEFCGTASYDVIQWSDLLLVENIETGERFKVRTEANIVWRGVSAERVGGIAASASIMEIKPSHRR
jgi:hypothetical protein